MERSRGAQPEKGGPASNSRPKDRVPPARGRKGVSKSRKSWGVKLNRKSNARAQGTKRAPVRNVSSHTPAPVKSRNIFPPRSFPPLYKKGKKGYNNPANARFYRCVGRLLLRMQGAGWLHTLSLLCTFLLCLAVFIINLYFPNFNFYLQAEPACAARRSECAKFKFCLAGQF